MKGREPLELPRLSQSGSRKKEKLQVWTQDANPWGWEASILPAVAVREIVFWAELRNNIGREGARGFRDFSRSPLVQENRVQPADPDPTDVPQRAALHTE
jgi:hypothetical protein